MIKVAIVENEEQPSEILRQYCLKYSQENKIKIEILIFNNGYDFLENYKADINAVFLDIDMPFLNGMEVATKLRMIDDEVNIIFVTNLAQYAIAGYKVHALDFILKPISYLDFELEMKKIIRKVESKQINNIVVTSKGIVKKIDFCDIEFIEMIKHNIIIHTISEDIEFRGVLKEIEEKLDNNLFSRCNNGYIVNLAYVREIKKDELILQSRKILTISRTRKKQFLDDLNKFMNGDI